jgi:hypothetical protein
MASERALTAVPPALTLLMALLLLLQIALHGMQHSAAPQAAALPRPPVSALFRAAGFGEDAALAKLAMLWLQSFDNQPGLSLPLTALDYERLIAWLELILELEPQASYPLLAASRIYAEVPDPVKARAMLDFVHAAFLQDPNGRWQWMAHAVYVAKHRLHDVPLALVYAMALAAHATGPLVPHWAQQMANFVLEDMGELEAAKVLLGGLLAGGKISDPHERAFLSKRLAALEAQAAAAAVE